MKIIGNEIIKQLHAQAHSTERLRMNYNLHENLNEDVHKSLNSLQPGTVMPIHRHLDPAKKETFVLLQGALEIRKYNSDKTIAESWIMSYESGNIVCEILPEEWHSFEVLELDTLIMEIKKGPYTPFSPVDLL